MLLAEIFFEFHAQVQKCHFGKNEKLPKWHFWTRAWNSKFFLAKSILLKHYENGDKKFFFVTCPRVYQIQDLCRKKCKKGIFSDVQWWKKILTHFSDSTHQECMVFARIGHGSCYYHWNEIFAGVDSDLNFRVKMSKKNCIRHVSESRQWKYSKKQSVPVSKRC